MNDRKIFKSLLKCTSGISGYYRHADVFQIYPSNVRDEKSPFYHAYLEYDSRYQANYKKAKNKSTYHPHLEQLETTRSHLNFLKEIIALLNISTNEHCELDFDSSNSLFPPPQEIIPNFSDISDLFEIRCRPSKISQRMKCNDQFVEIHPNAGVFFGNYFKLNPRARNRYNASIFLYSNGEELLVKCASMAVVAYASSVENIIDFEKSRKREMVSICDKCGQKQHKISLGFREFLQLHSNSDLDRGNSLFNKFYSTRSKIVHAGSILDFDRMQTIFPVKEYENLVEFSALVRISLFNYLVNYDFELDSK